MSFQGFLRQSTSRIVRVGKFVDVTDGLTPETGITLGAADQAEALKAGGGASIDISAATFAAVTGADGYYDLTLTTGFTDTVGDLLIAISDDSVCLPVEATFQVIEENVYDAYYAASGAAGTDLAAILVDTNELQTDWVNGGRLDLLIDAIKAVTDLLNAAQTEPTGVPAANETPLDKLAYMFMGFRNKITSTATKKTYFGDDDAAEFEKDLTDDGTTYTESELNAI